MKWHPKRRPSRQELRCHLTQWWTCHPAFLMVLGAKTPALNQKKMWLSATWLKKISVPHRLFASFKSFVSFVRHRLKHDGSTIGSITVFLPLQVFQAACRRILTPEKGKVLSQLTDSATFTQSLSPPRRKIFSYWPCWLLLAKTSLVGWWPTWDCNQKSKWNLSVQNLSENVQCFCCIRRIIHMLNQRKRTYGQADNLS